MAYYYFSGIHFFHTTCNSDTYKNIVVLAGISKGKLRKSKKFTQITFFCFEKVKHPTANSTPMIDFFISWSLVTTTSMLVAGFF